MHILRVYADADGESHFEDVEPELEVREGEFRTGVSPLWSAKSMQFIEAPANFASDFHPASERQFVLLLSGRLEMITSDGERREVGSPTILLMEDTTGK